MKALNGEQRAMIVVFIILLIWALVGSVLDTVNAEGPPEFEDCEEYRAAYFEPAFAAMIEAGSLVNPADIATIRSYAMAVEALHDYTLELVVPDDCELHAAFINALETRMGLNDSLMRAVLADMRLMRVYRASLPRETGGGRESG